MTSAMSRGYIWKWRYDLSENQIVTSSGYARYSQWIADNRPADPSGQCKAVTQRMAAAFLELRRVRGHYVCPSDGRLQHWWMVTPDGEIIDPTRDQFISTEHGNYEEYVGAEPTGRCLSCDALLFGDEQVCDEECAKEFGAYLEESVGDSDDKTS